MHTRALELQTLVVEYYRGKAKEAKQRRRYQTAIQNYEKILKIIPNDVKTQQALDNILAINKK